MDIGTGLTLFGFTSLATKVLGPTADYLGQGLKGVVEQRAKNVQRIFENAAKKLGPQLEEPGAVPARVLSRVLDEGSYCDDDLMASYFGGVLASSRTETGRDDRGQTYLALIGRLSTYQVRAHYVLYWIAQRLKAGYANGDPQLWPTNAMAYVPFTAFNAAMEFSDGENTFQVNEHTLSGLEREGLLTNLAWGSVSDWGRRFSPSGMPFPDPMLSLLAQFPDPYHNKYSVYGVVFSPTIVGAQLFLWGIGHGRRPLDMFFSDEAWTDPVIPSLTVPTDAMTNHGKPGAQAGVDDTKKDTSTEKGVSSSSIS